jgi:hypothetical protein
MMAKSKSVAGVDLPPSSFAYVGDVNVTNTWKHAIHVPGDERKTVNLIKSALSRFHEVKVIPAEQRFKVWQKIAGAAAAHGINVNEADAPPEKSEHALADLLCDRFLKGLGY